MSSYSEFKSDVKSAAAGVVLFLVATLLLKIVFLAVLIAISAAIIFIRRALFGRDREKEQHIKLYSLLTIGSIMIVTFIYNYTLFVSSGGRLGFGQKMPTPQEQQATHEWIEKELAEQDKRLKERTGMTSEEYWAKWKK